MALARFAFEQNGAHAGALLGVIIATILVFGIRRRTLGAIVLLLVMSAYVGGYLWYVWLRFQELRTTHAWSTQDQFAALGLIVLTDSRIGTAPIPVALAGLLGAVSLLALIFSSINILALPTWVLLLLIVPLMPYLLPVALGAAAYRLRRHGQVSESVTTAVETE